MPKYHKKKYYQKKSYHKRHYLLQTFVTVLAVIFTILAVVAFVAYASPMMFIELLSHLLSNIGDVIFMDIVLRGGTGLLVFAIGSAILWYARSRIQA